jgi:hypothetical protein
MTAVLCKITEYYTYAMTIVLGVEIACYIVLFPHHFGAFVTKCLTF